MASSAAPKVPVYSANDLKSTTDDALSPYLTTLPQPYAFAQDHTKSTVRFVIGYTAVAIAGFTFYADRYLGWEATRSPWIVAAVGVYFTLNTLFTIWVWMVEGGEVFWGRRRGGDGEVISIRSSGKKQSAQYKLRVLYKSAKGQVLEDKEIESSFTKWFSADGVFHQEPLRQWLAEEIGVLKLAAKETEKRTGGVSGLVGVSDGEETGATKRR